MTMDPLASLGLSFPTRKVGLVRNWIAQLASIPIGIVCLFVCLFVVSFVLKDSHAISITLALSSQSFCLSLEGYKKGIVKDLRKQHYPNRTFFDYSS